MVQTALDNRRHADWKAPCVVGGERGGKRGDGKVVEALIVKVAATEHTRDLAKQAAAAANPEGWQYKFCNTAQRDLEDAVREIDRDLSRMRCELRIEQKAHDGKSAGGKHGDGKVVTALLVDLDTLNSERDVAERAVIAAGIKQSRSTFWTKKEQSLVSKVTKIKASIEKLLGELKTEQKAHDGQSGGGKHGHGDTIKNLETSIAETKLALEVAGAAAAASSIGDAQRSHLCEKVVEYERELKAMCEKLKVEKACNASKSANGIASRGTTSATGPGAVCLKAVLKTPDDNVPSELPLRGTRGSKPRTLVNSSSPGVATSFIDQGVNKHFFGFARELSKGNEEADFRSTSCLVRDDDTKMWVPRSRLDNNGKEAVSTYKALCRFVYSEVTEEKYMSLSKLLGSTKPAATKVLTLQTRPSASQSSQRKQQQLPAFGGVLAALPANTAERPGAGGAGVPSTGGKMNKQQQSAAPVRAPSNKRLLSEMTSAHPDGGGAAGRAGGSSAAVAAEKVHSKPPMYAKKAKL